MKIKAIILSIFISLTITATTQAEYFKDIIVTGPDAIWTDSRAYSTLNDAISAVGTNERTIVVASEEVVTDLTIPSNVTLDFRRGGKISYTGQLTINTPNIIANDYVIFNPSGLGEADFAQGTSLRTAWFNNLDDAFNQTSDDYVILIVNSGWSAEITTDATVGDNITLKWEGSGHCILASAGTTLSNIKNIEAGSQCLFAGSGDFDFVDGIELRSGWFNNFTAAVNWIDTTEATLIIDSEEAVNSITTIPSNITLKFERNGAINNSDQLTINTKNIIAPDRQIFTGTGDIDFATGSVVRSSWFSDLTESINVTEDDWLTLVISGGHETLTSSCSVGDNVTLKWESRRNRIIAPTGITLSNIGDIEAGDYQLFAGAGDFDFRPGSILKSSWFYSLSAVDTFTDDDNVDLTIIVDRPETIDTSMEFDQYQGLKVSKGCPITINNATLTQEGFFDAGLHQAFNCVGTGKVSFGSESVEGVYPEWLGAKGDGVTDDTNAIQMAIDSAAYKVVLSQVYKVSKTTGYAVDFPNNDQPCLFVKNKTSFSLYGIDGATLTTDVHAQGILELQLCSNVIIEGITFKGAGQYPPLDGTTGRGEKGVSDAGYYTSGFWGYYKNNSHDTSANNSGGFGGAFPQWGGGTATTWGEWNGGYIGNVSYGVLIHNGCKHVTVRNCTVSDFNYVGIGVGHNGDYWPTDLGYADSEDIKILNCQGLGCYSTNFHSMAVDGFLLDSCLSKNCGHPNALITDTSHDPGYGYTSRGSDFSSTKNAIISHNLVHDCVRKGLDSHGHENLSFLDNTILDCWAFGISFGWHSNLSKSVGTTCTGNSIIRCGTAPAGVGTYAGIYTKGRIDADYSYDNILLNALIADNRLVDCGMGIRVRVGRNVTVKNNEIIGCGNTFGYGIFVGRGTDTSYNITVSGNVIDANGDTALLRGIQIQNLEQGIVVGNVVKLDHDSADIGLYHIDATKTDYYNNRIYMLTGTPIAISQSTGGTHSNYAEGGSLNSYFFSYAKTQFKVATRIALTITFNGTANPDVVYLCGSDFIDSVTSTLQGVGIALKGFANGEVLPSFFNGSSEGLMTAGGARMDYLYVRSRGYTSIDIGIKETISSSTHVPASDLTSGTLLVYIDIL